MIENQEINIDLMNVSDFEQEDELETTSQALQVNEVESSTGSRKRKIVESARNLLK